jgi:hypothetical protein
MASLLPPPRRRCPPTSSVCRNSRRTSSPSAWSATSIVPSAASPRWPSTSSGSASPGAARGGLLPQPLRGSLAGRVDRAPSSPVRSDALPQSRLLLGQSVAAGGEGGIPALLCAPVEQGLGSGRYSPGAVPGPSALNTSMAWALLSGTVTYSSSVPWRLRATSAIT